VSDLVGAPRRSQAEQPLWKLVPLGDLCRTTSGGTPSRKRPDYFHGPIPWVKSGELTDGPVSEVEEFITEEALADSSAKVFRAGTLLIALYGATVGKLGVLTRDAATNQAICAIFPPKELDTRFLFWYLRHRRADLVARAVGGAQPNISQAILRGVDVPVPPIAQQRRIVAEIEKQFSRLDEAVANLQRVKDRLVAYKGSIISEAVGGIDTVDDGNAPTGWRRCRLGDAAAKITSGSRDWSPYYGRGDSIFLLAQNVRPMSPDLSVLQHVDPPEADPARARSRVQRGDLLVTIVGANTGQACMVCDLPGETFVCQSVALVRPVLVASAPYLNLWLNSPEHGRRYFDRCMYGQGRPHLGFEQLASMPIAIPPPHMQARIVAEVDRRLSIVREVEAEVDANLKRAQALRQAVLAQAFAV
jgi:type I restriction enzyme S subunit